MDKDFKRWLGKRFRQARRRRGWTQAEMADRGLSARYYAMVERGEVNPSLEILERIAGAFNTTLYDMVKLSPKMTEDEEMFLLLYRILKKKRKKDMEKLRGILKGSFAGKT